MQQHFLRLHACFAIIYKFVVGVMSQPPYAPPAMGVAHQQLNAQFINHTFPHI